MGAYHFIHQDSVRGRLLEAVKRGPANAGAIALRVQLTYQQTQSNLAHLVAEGRIAVIGNVGEALVARRRGREDIEIKPAGCKFVRRDAKVYAVHGTRPLPELPPDTETTKHAAIELPRRTAGSGKIAGPRTIGTGLAGWGVWR